MGSFLGHVFPGTFFVLFGIWWTHCVFLRIHRFRMQSKQFVSSCTYMQMEGFIKLFASLIGIVAEAVTGYSDGSIQPHNRQHILMYAFFAMNGFFDVCVMVKLSADRSGYSALLPPGIQRFSTCLALVAQFLLFRFHLYGKTDLDSHVHVLLLICNAFAILSCLAEWIYNDQPLAALSRALATLLMGTWFIQIAFILYSPFQLVDDWPLTGHHMYMNVTTLFVFHGFICILIICTWGFLCNRALRDQMYTSPSISSQDSKEEIKSLDPITVDAYQDVC